MDKPDSLDDLMRNEQKAREQATVCTDVSVRVEHLARAALYAEMIKKMRL